MAAMAMVVFIDGGCRQRRQRWDGGTMMQWHPQRWRLWPMVAAAMVFIIVNCAVAVDAATTNPSLVSMAAANTQSLPLTSTATSIDNDYYCRHQ
jgi:hypothetical protein